MTDNMLQRSTPLASGFTSDVYTWGEGRVLKLFLPSVPITKIEREFRATRAVHAAGLPVPAAHELVEIEGRRGIVFERIDGVSMFSQVQAKPWTLLSAVRQLADLQAQIHRCVCPFELPSQREWIGSYIDASTVLSPAEKQAAHQSLEVLPDGNAICHGDFHPANILMTGQGPVVIDWDTATRGHPMGDIACTARLIETASLPDWAAWHTHLLLKWTRSLIHRRYLQRSLQLHGGTRQQLEAWAGPLAAAGTARQIPGR